MRTLVIANGELFLYDDAAPAPRPITSPFARDVVERDERSRRHTSWKHAPRDEQSGIIPSSSLWGRGSQGKAMAPPRFLFACFGADDDTVFYVMRIGEAVGLLRRHLVDDRELRLFHKTGNLVPGSWALVRVKTDGAHEVVARHVAGFTLGDDGSVTYTNGYDLTRWRDGDKPRSLGRQELVEGVFAR